MTPPALYACPCGHPDCEETKPTAKGAKMYAINKTDEAHAHIKSAADIDEEPKPLDRRDVDEEPASESRDGPTKTPDIPPAEKKTGNDTKTMDCPNCDTDLDVTEKELREEIESAREKNQVVTCESCDAVLMEGE